MHPALVPLWQPGQSLNCWLNGVTIGGLTWPSFFGPFSGAQFDSRIHEAI